MGVVYFLGLALGAYLIGGLNGAIITSRLAYKDDVRKHGSGNAGLTNFLRTYGGRAVFLVVLIDVLKTAFPLIMGGTLLETAFTFGTVSERIMIGRTFGGLFAMIGHAYPCMYKFKGGKAALSSATLALFLDIRIFGIFAAVFLLAVLLTRYISLGSILAGISLPVSYIVLGLGLWPTILAFCCAAFVVFRHHGNIGRLVKGEERKISFQKRKA